MLGNVLLLFWGRLVLVLLSLASTPILFHRLGGDAFGVYVLALTFGGLLGLLDLGLTPAVISFLSRSCHARDDAATQRIISTAFSLYLAIGIVGGVLLLILVPWLVVGLLKVPAGLRDPAIFALQLSTGGFVLNMWLGAFYAVPFALERFGLITGRTIGLGVATTTAIILYALHGGGIKGLVAINVAGAAIGIVLFAAISRSLLPQIRFRPRIDVTTLKALAGFSAFKFAGTIGGILTFRFDQLAIASLLGVNAVGLYAIPANLSSRIQGLFSELASPLFPRAGKLRGDPDGARRLFLTSSRALTLMSAGVLSTLFVYADLVLLYWIGGAQGLVVARQSTAALHWLLAAFFIQSLALIPAIFSEGMGRPALNNSFAVASAVIHVPLVLVLVPRFGITGAALALFINGSVQTVVFIGVASWRIAKLTPADVFARSVARPLAAVCIAGGFGYLIRPMVHGLGSLGLAVLLTAAAYLLASVVLGAVKAEDLAHLHRFFRRLPAWFPGRTTLLRAAPTMEP